MLFLNLILFNLFILISQLFNFFLYCIHIKFLFSVYTSLFVSIIGTSRFQSALISPRRTWADNTSSLKNMILLWYFFIIIFAVFVFMINCDFHILFTKWLKTCKILFMFLNGCPIINALFSAVWFQNLLNAILLFA